MLKCCLCFIHPAIAPAQSRHLQLHARLGELTGLPASAFPAPNLVLRELYLSLSPSSLQQNPSWSILFSTFRTVYLTGLQGPPEPGHRASLAAALPFPQYPHLPCSWTGLCLFVEGTLCTLRSAASLSPFPLPGTPPPPAFFLGSRLVPWNGHPLLIPSPKLTRPFVSVPH